MLTDKIFGIVCLVALGLGEFVYCYYSNTTPSNTGTIVGAVAGFVTGVTVMGGK
jgi:hypothetical protein